MKARIIPEECIACGLCTDVCPSVFRLVDLETVEAVGEVPEGDEDAARESAEGCPVEAIVLDG